MSCTLASTREGQTESIKSRSLKFVETPQFKPRMDRWQQMKLEELCSECEEQGVGCEGDLQALEREELEVRLHLGRIGCHPLESLEQLDGLLQASSASKIFKMDRSGHSSQWIFCDIAGDAQQIVPFAKEDAADLAFVAFASIATRARSGTVIGLYVRAYAYIICVCTCTNYIMYLVH